MIKLMLDTNICIYILKQQPASVLQALKRYKIGELAVSSIVHGELVYGAYKSTKSLENLSKIESLMDALEVLTIDEEVVHHYGKIRTLLEQKGQVIGSNDFWIAAHALALQVPLVTNNSKEFIKVPELEVINWV